MSLSPRRITAFKLSLLASLGLLPIACGGSSTGSAPDEDTAGTSPGGTASGGASSGGTTSGGTTSGGTRTMDPGSAGSKLDGGAPTVSGPCTMPTTDPITGLVTCAEGYRHRPKVVDCQYRPTKAFPGGGGTTGNPAGEAPPRATGEEPCAADPSVCNDFAYGYCFASQICQSGCVNDFDCKTGEICECGDAQSPTGGVCRASGCTVDAECGPGLLCATYEVRAGANGPVTPLLACHSPADKCRSSAECGPEQACEWNATDKLRACQDPCFACGRPFLIEAAPRLAPITNRSDWSDCPAPSVAHLSELERATQAAHWTKLGQMEHASIAAFARFSLQLLSLGAPAQLVEACTQALADETAHTRLCFGLASAYAGRAIGPGPLDISGSLDVSSLEDIVDLVIAEGCFGETSAALDALEAADRAADPVIRAAYAKIAADEQRHAELAFRFVRWALLQDPAAVRARLEAALASPPSRDGTALGVAVPCLSALLEATPPAPAAARAPANLPVI